MICLMMIQLGYSVVNSDGKRSAIDPDLLGRCCIVLVRTEGPVNLVSLPVRF
jgi:hypothetical protein